jgi:hypothetical protein
VRLEIHVYHHVHELEALMSALDDLTAQVTATDGVIDSAIAALNGLAAALAAAGTDPTKLAALQTELKAKTEALAAAIAATAPPAA